MNSALGSLRLLRRAAPVLVACCLCFAGGVGYAAEARNEAQAEAAIARLSDQEVRQLLIDQLATAPSAGSGAQEFNPAVIAYRLQREVGRVSEELDAIFGSVGELPSVFPRAWEKFTADRDEGGLAWFVIALLVSMGVGGSAALVLRSRVTPGLRALDQRHPQATRAKFGILLTRLGLHLLYIAAFSLTSLAVFVIFFDAGQKDRTAFLFYLVAGVIFMLAIALSLAFHAPRRPALRLPLYTDRQARSLHRAVLLTVGFGAFAFFTCVRRPRIVLQRQ